MSAGPGCYSFDKRERVFPNERKMSAIITLNRSAVSGGVPTPAAINECVRAFRRDLPRLSRLARYFDGRHDILARARLAGLPNNRLTHAYPRYIAQVSASYLLGEPVRVDGPEPGASALRELLIQASADSVDLEIAIAQAVFGRGVSLCYEDDASGAPFVCALDPRTAFVVYDDTVAHEPLFGVYVHADGSDNAFLVYTADAVHTLRSSSPRSIPTAVPHAFGAVPMVEYLNGPDAHGDFEDVLSLIDAYDLLQCDRLNDRQQFSDALLVLTGVMGVTGAPGDTFSPLERLRSEKTLSLPDSDAKAEWLVKNANEKDIDVLRLALAQDIHKFSLTPDFSDESFSGNASGIAIKYKLFNFDNRIKLKERYFVTGLRERARAFCGWLASRRGLSLDADSLSFRLSRRLPVNEAERAASLKDMADILPAETLRYHSPFSPAPAGSGGDA